MPRQLPAPGAEDRFPAEARTILCTVDYGAFRLVWRNAIQSEVLRRSFEPEKKSGG